MLNVSFRSTERQTPITVKKALSKVEGVSKVDVGFEKREAVVTFDDTKASALGDYLPTRLEMVMATISAVPTQPETEKAYRAGLALASMM